MGFKIKTRGNTKDPAEAKPGDAFLDENGDLWIRVVPKTNQSPWVLLGLDGIAYAASAEEAPSADEATAVDIRIEVL